MIHMPRFLPVLVGLLFYGAGGPRVCAESVSINPALDNTLYEYDYTDLNSPFNSNGSGDFFSAGRNFSRSLLRRGLIYFDLSGVPAGAQVVPGSAALTLEVVDAPKKDTTGQSRPFWLVPVDRAWGEGASTANAGMSGAGSGAAAAAGDATWLHTSYNPAIHDPRNPNLADPGYWPLAGVLGDAPVDPTIFGAPAGLVPAAPYLGPVSFASPGLEADLNAWLASPGTNFGWLVVGDERVDSTTESSNRGFASREHSDHPPLLTFQYVLVPEPPSFLILLTALAIFCWRLRSGW